MIAISPARTTRVPRIALIGAGSMGSNHARVLAASERASLSLVVDAVAGRARALAEHYGTAWSADPLDALRCDAAVVACSTDAHAEIARELLGGGAPTLVEKPVSTAMEEVESLVRHSEERDVPLMCGFVERFNPALNTAATLLDEPPIHILAVRHSPATPRATMSVIHDLLIHDVDICLRLAGGALESVTGGAWSPRSGRVVEIADCVMRFDDGAMATASASRASQRKVRTLSIETASKLVELDLMRHDATVYQHHSHAVDGLLPGYRAQTTVDIPFVRHGGEPLGLQLDHFVDLLNGDADADTERQSILPPHRVIAALAAA